MPNDGRLITPQVLQENHDRPLRKWREYVVAAPGHRVVPPVSSTLSGAGGFVFGCCAAMTVMNTSVSWLGLLFIALGIPLGVVYARFMRRFGHNGRLIARGEAARLTSDGELTERVVAAAKRNAPGYFPLAVRAARLDVLRDQIRELEKSGDTSAELTVRREELARDEQSLTLLTARDALARGAAMLAISDASDAAATAAAAGEFTRLMYAEIEEGRAQSYDADS